MEFLWIAGSSPRLSGLASGPLEGQLMLRHVGSRLGSEEAVDSAPDHEVCSDQPGEGERAFDGTLSGVGQSQQQEGDEGDSDLDADGIFGSAEEFLELEYLFDPAEEQLDGPSPLVEI